MGKYLEAFANNFMMDNDNEVRTPKHQELCEKSCRIHDELEDKLSGKDRELLEQLMDSINEEVICDSQTKFIRGFSIGLMVAIEIMDELELFITNP